jgi:1,4-dihydroxy-6-naphthoate synthase
VLDLGQWWQERHDGLPLPLGVNAARRDLGPDLCRRIDRVLRRSIEYGLAHRREALAYAMQWGRNLTASLADRFVGMYVNEWTRDTAGRGRPAIARFLSEAAGLGLIPSEYELRFVE